MCICVSSHSHNSPYLKLFTSSTKGNGWGLSSRYSHLSLAQTLWDGCRDLAVYPTTGVPHAWRVWLCPAIDWLNHFCKPFNPQESPCLFCCIGRRLVLAPADVIRNTPALMCIHVISWCPRNTDVTLSQAVNVYRKQILMNSEMRREMYGKKVIWRSYPRWTITKYQCCVCVTINGTYNQQLVNPVVCVTDIQDDPVIKLV